jgi:hypothetical protein
MASSNSIYHFLHLECLTIAALVDEVSEYEMSVEEETVNMKMIDQVSRYPELQSYFHADIDIVMPRFQSWSRSVRVFIVDHLITMDINVSLLIEIVENYRFEAEIEELVEIVRALDILGAERRFLEYEAVLYIKLTEMKVKEKDWEGICGERLPVSFFDRVKHFNCVKLRASFLGILGLVGSQRLIEYFLENHDKSNKNIIFDRLCHNGHLSVAQWLYGLGGINIHTNKDDAFRFACRRGHLSVVQWLYGLGGIDIHVHGDEPFRMACRRGHLSVAQWLYDICGVNIHAEHEEAFRLACSNGHLSVVEWLYGLGRVDIHVNGDEPFRMACGNGHFSAAQFLWRSDNVDIHVRNDYAFRCACTNGHLSVAQWLYGLGGIDIHAFHDYAFRWACGNGHILVVQWLYGLGGVDIHTNNEEAFRSACGHGHLLMAQWLYGLGGIDIHINNDDAFRSASSSGNFEVARWLYNLGGISTDVVQACINSAIHVEIISWLQSIDSQR